MTTVATPGACQGGGHIDGADAGVGVRAADEGGVQQARFGVRVFGFRSATKRPRPSSILRSSFRGTGAPTQRPSKGTACGVTGVPGAG